MIHTGSFIFFVTTAQSVLRNDRIALHVHQRLLAVLTAIR